MAHAVVTRSAICGSSRGARSVRGLSCGWRQASDLDKAVADGAAFLSEWGLIASPDLAHVGYVIRSHHIQAGRLWYVFSAAGSGLLLPGRSNNSIDQSQRFPENSLNMVYSGLGLV